jgi:hypothetical protein
MGVSLSARFKARAHLQKKYVNFVRTPQCYICKENFNRVKSRILDVFVVATEY